MFTKNDKPENMKLFYSVPYFQSKKNYQPENTRSLHLTFKNKTWSSEINKLLNDMTFIRVPNNFIALFLDRRIKFCVCMSFCLRIFHSTSIKVLHISELSYWNYWFKLKFSFFSFHISYMKEYILKDRNGKIRIMFQNLLKVLEFYIFTKTVNERRLNF